MYLPRRAIRSSWASVAIAAALVTLGAVSVPLFASPAYAASPATITVLNDGTGAHTRYTIGVTLGAALASYDEIIAVAPTGTDFSNCYGAYVTDETDSADSGNAGCYTGNNSNTLVVSLGNAVTGSHTLSIALTNVINPTAAVPGATMQVSTTAEPSAVRSLPYNIVTRSVSTPSVVPANHAPGGSGDITLSFRTSPSGSLGGDSGNNVYAVAPNGFDFSNCYSATVVDKTNPAGTGSASCYTGQNNNTLVLALDNAVGAGDALEITLGNIGNPPTPNDAYTWKVATSSDQTDSTSAPFYIDTSPPPGSGSTFTGLPSARIFDATVGTTPSGVTVAGVGGVPADATAVVVNVEVFNPSTAGYVRVTPFGSDPAVAVQEFTAGQSISNLVVVKVVSGKIQAKVSAGSARVLMDVAGYYSASTTGSRFTGLPTARVFDATVGGTPVPVRVAGVGGVPANATAVVVNVEVFNPSTAGYVRVTPFGSDPAVAVQEFKAGQSISNLVVVKVVNGKIQAKVSAGSARVLMDVAGYYS